MISLYDLAMEDNWLSSTLYKVIVLCTYGNTIIRSHMQYLLAIKVKQSITYYL